MEHDVPHDLSLDQAKDAARRVLSDYAARFSRYAPVITWRTDSQADVTFTIKGASLSGSLNVLSDRFALRLDVPFLLRPFSGRAIAVIDAKVRAEIAKAKEK